jgi:CDP-diacylglycerol--serine O-phosphatidyltransferase
MILSPALESGSFMSTSPKQPRKGVYLLPNLMTTGALFAGFYSIIAGIGEQYIPAAIAVVPLRPGLLWYRPGVADV